MKRKYSDGFFPVPGLKSKDIFNSLAKKIFYRGGGIMGICFWLMAHPVKAQSPQKAPDIYAKDNLVAWCIVPFDVKERNAEERAQMLNELGITKLAYDWREKHIPSFDAELDALKKHRIKLQAFWLVTGPDPAHDANINLIFDLLKRHSEKTELWVMVGGIPGLDDMTQEEKVVAVSKPVAYLAQRAAEIGCKIGIYNHGGWFGEPENQLAIIDYLKKPNIGMVYNFSHSETQIQRFDQFFPKIMPHLLCINLTGLIDSYPATVVPVGTGNMEARLMEKIYKSGYRGPIGIINENFAKDAKIGLEMNMNGLVHILKEMRDKKALKTYQ
ncbi:hypothetical protein [Compostibacter hankyongensis]|uniref:TIM barrel protein n=1 Tax=Compostibacter hankyongensis TaxID=1007089 RepID=A0ABP8FRC3_9BACT